MTLIQLSKIMVSATSTFTKIDFEKMAKIVVIFHGMVYMRVFTKIHEL